MTLSKLTGYSWTRKHDDPDIPHFASVPEIRVPQPRSALMDDHLQTLEDLITFCQDGATRGNKTRAVGSHWALSDAAISDYGYIETHAPDNGYQAMGRTLFEVVPRCLNRDLLNYLGDQWEIPPAYFVHVESGKRIYQLYSELDYGDQDNQESLARAIEGRYGNTSYLGAWSFETLGGAGGQTVLGALTTGTHGGDWQIPPIADSVQALHLVADGGVHYWIEPSAGYNGFTLTDDDALKQVYGIARFGGPGNFQIVRDDDLFESVLVGVGRFGVIYSIVLKAVPQFALHEERRLHVSPNVLNTWQAVRSSIGNSAGPLYQVAPPAAAKSHFLQVALCLTPYGNPLSNLCGVTKRWKVGIPPGAPGRAERRGDIDDAFDVRIQGPRFSRAGNSFAYTPVPGNLTAAQGPSMLARACAYANFLEGLIQEVIDDIVDFLENNVVSQTLNTVAGIGSGGLLPLDPALWLLIELLKLFLDELKDELVQGVGARRAGEVIGDLSTTLLDHQDPAERLAGVILWRMISYKIFAEMQSDQDFEALSYAVMDTHDYHDISCNVNVDSIEVFFAANDPMLPAFIDAIAAFERAQEENDGRAFVGYASLRFTGATRAKLGMQRYPVTCAVEIAGLLDAKGTRPLIDYALTFARNHNVHGILHWGQRNPCNSGDTEFIFGDTPSSPSGDLLTWRQSLSAVTDNGRLDRFSSAFSRQTGLEVVQPRISLFSSNQSALPVGGSCNLQWDCTANPSTATMTLTVIDPSGNVFTTPLATRTGSRSLTLSEAGATQAILTATVASTTGDRTSSASITITAT